MRIKELEKYVLRALEDCERARKDDFLLYGIVLEYKNIQVLDATLRGFLGHAKELGVPSFESVSRCRRHIQELRPDLKDTKTAIAREEAQEEYKEYNLTGIGG